MATCRLRNTEVLCANHWREVPYVRDGHFSSIGGRLGLADKWQGARGSGSMLHRIHRRMEGVKRMNERQIPSVSIGRLFISCATYNYFTHFLHIASKTLTPTSRSDERSLQVLWPKYCKRFKISGQRRFIIWSSGLRHYVVWWMGTNMNRKRKDGDCGPVFYKLWAAFARWR